MFCHSWRWHPALQVVINNLVTTANATSADCRPIKLFCEYRAFRNVGRFKQHSYLHVSVTIVFPSVSVVLWGLWFWLMNDGWMCLFRNWPFCDGSQNENKLTDANAMSAMNPEIHVLLEWLWIWPCAYLSVYSLVLSTTSSRHILWLVLKTVYTRDVDHLLTFVWAASADVEKLIDTNTKRQISRNRNV